MARESKKNGKFPIEVNNNHKNNKQQQEKLLKNNKNNKTMLASNEHDNDDHKHQQHHPLTNGDVEIIINNKRQNNIDIEDDDDDINKKNGCLKRIFIFIFILMGLTLLLTAIFYAILIFPTILDNDNQCFDYKYSFQHTNFKLFSTKTTYTTSYQQLNQSSSSSLNLLSKLEIPNIFSRRNSLKQLHNNLINDNCKVKQFHYIGRHAARFPSSKDIDQLNKLLLNIQNRIDLTKYTPNNNNKPTTNITIIHEQQQQKAPASVCLNPLAEYKSWTSSMSIEQGNLITDYGMEETEAIASRFKEIYPDLFNGTLTDIDFGSTKELRTAQTALAFLKQFENFKLHFCDFNQFPHQHLSDISMAKILINNDCLRKFIDNYYKEKLDFHNKCENYHEIDYPITHNLHLNEPNRTKSISISVSKKLKLNKDQYLTYDETMAIYKMCKYETALPDKTTNTRQQASIWCNLFSENDLKFFEYLDDIKYFFEVYGHPDQARSSCPITTDLLKSFKTIEKSILNNNLGGGEQDFPLAEAKFYFTHSEVIQKLLATMIDLESSDNSYLTKNILAHLEAGTAPNNRQWRTSLLSPFSANIAFIVYQCPSTTESELKFENKLITTLNEQPILIDGCQDYTCSISGLIDDSRIFKERRCKLDEICKKRIIIN